MRRLMLAMGALTLLGAGAFGCSHTVDTARAEYHENKAEHAASRGNYYKAAREEHKAESDQAKAATAPLP